MQNFYITESQLFQTSNLVPRKQSRDRRLFTEHRIYSFDEVINTLEDKDPININVIMGNQKIPILSKNEYPLLSRLFVVMQETMVLSRLEVRGI